MKKKENEIYYYETLQDDFVTTSDQNYQLPEDYVWIKKGILTRAAAQLLYALSIAFGKIYSFFFLHMRIVRSTDLRNFRDTGAVIYSNHTQALGDVFTPVVTCAHKRCYIVAAPANLGIPFIGKFLPLMGALPVPSSSHGMRDFLDAINKRINEKNCVVVYPETHVWPYYTDIRPFAATSFSYAVKNHVPAFAMTSTYQFRKKGGRPKTTVYFDGPFYPDESLPEHSQKSDLRDKIYENMQKRSRESTYSYIEYRPLKENEEK